MNRGKENEKIEFAQQAVREQRIPFEIRMDIPNKETLQAMNNTVEGKNLSKTFESVEELMEDLNANISNK